MSTPKRVVGVVIARQASKGLPHKNLARIGQYSLLLRTILTAKQAKTLDRVILSTDSPEMARIGKKAGAEVPFLRPKHLAQDKTHTPEVIEHAIHFLETHDKQKVDIVVTLQPTSPFRRPEHIDAAVNLLLTHKDMDSVVSVKVPDFPPYWTFRTKGKILLPLFGGGVDYSLKERQELPLVFQPNGAVYATQRNLLSKRGLIFSAFAKGKTGFVLMDALSSIDIDNPLDLVMARLVLNQHPELDAGLAENSRR